MRIEKIETLLKQGEGLEVEFKTAHFELNKNTFETICAFLNRKGGHLLLGVDDNGKVEGVLESCMPDMVNNLVTTANNPVKLSPPFYFSPEVIEYEGKKIIYLYVPESPQVHSTAGKIVDRNGDGDFDITRQSALVTNLYLRKQSTYSENQVFPYFEMADCNAELFKRIRLLAASRQSGHSWATMSDEEIVRSAGLYRRDIISGKSGFKTIIPLKSNDGPSHGHSDTWDEVRRRVRRKFVEKFVENWEKPLELIYQDRSVSAAGIATKTGLSHRAVQNQLAKMREIGIIQRIGADKGGYWVINL